MPGHVVTKPAELLHHLSVLTVSAIDASVVELSDLTVDEVKDREQHVDRLLGLRRLWRKSGKQLRFEAVEDADGHPHSDPQAAACLLAAHWGPIFAPPVEQQTVGKKPAAAGQECSPAFASEHSVCPLP